MLKKIKLFFFFFSLVCGFVWVNFSVSTSPSVNILANVENIVNTDPSISYPGVTPSLLRDKKKYKNDDQRIIIFQKNWEENPKKNYFIWASIFGLETVALDSAGAFYTYAETFYKPLPTRPNSFRQLFLTKDFFLKKVKDKWTKWIIPQWTDNKSNKTNYKMWFESSNLASRKNINFVKLIYIGEHHFLVVYKITDFLSEIRKIVKTENKDLSTLDIDFTQFQGKARKQLLAMLDGNGNLRSGIWDSIDNQIQNSLKQVEDQPGQLVLQKIRALLLKVQGLGISKVSHPFFPGDYDLGFLKDNPNWKKISFKDLLQGMELKINGAYVDFYSHLFPGKKVFQIPIYMKELDTIFSEITITNIIKSLEKAISDHPQKEKQFESKNQGLIIGLSVAGGVLFLSVLGGFLYWFFKIKK